MMRGHCWKALITILLTVAILCESAPVWAQSYDPSQEPPKPTTVEKALTKLGRGVSNVFFGLAEIPFTFDKKLKQGKPLTYLLTVAPVLGAARAVVRMGTGVYEVATFPYSSRKVNFEPLLEPEYLF